MTMTTTTTTTTTSTSTSTMDLHRCYAKHVPKWQKFQTTILSQEQSSNNNNNVYQRQYSHVYYERLTMLKKRCWDSVNDDKATDSKNDVEKISRVLELRENVTSIVVGTIVKEQCTDKDSEKLIPSDKTNNCYSKDTLYLEDESGRIILDIPKDNPYNKHSFCTGSVVAVKGIINDESSVGGSGVLSVSKFYYPKPMSYPPQQQQTNSSSSSHDESTPSDDDEEPHIMLISGLDCSSPDVSSLPRDMILSYLQGLLTPTSRKVCRVIVAGGGCTSTANNVDNRNNNDEKDEDDAHKAAKGIPTTTDTDLLHGIQELDKFLSQIIASGIPVDIMPGQHDPTSCNWPQRPIHSSLLKYANTFKLIKPEDGQEVANGEKLLHRTPNPYSSTVQSKYLIGTDGRNVFDLQSYSVTPKLSDDFNDDNDATDEKERCHYEQVSELFALEQTHKYKHMCPTGPDSVPTVPHKEIDPMVITHTPHVYFVGNCNKFDTKEIVEESCKKGEEVKTRLLCVPKFSTTQQVVLLNMSSLNCELLHFEM